MTDETGRIIARRQLGNGMEVTLYDRSRLISGSRWHVELLCEANLTIAESTWETVAGKDKEHLPAIRKMLGDRLQFASSRKRNFVDFQDMEEILREMVQEVYTSTLGYLNRPDFPQKLFKKHYLDARRKLLLQEAMNQVRKTVSGG
jgi:hypothetical protein